MLALSVYLLRQYRPCLWSDISALLSSTIVVTAAVPSPVTRYLLLAHEHGHAAAKAVTAMQPLLQALLKHLLLPEASTSGSATAGTSAQAAAGPTSACAGMQLLTSPAVVQLLRWQTYLESLSVAMLPQACWHDCFALILLASALRAFIHDYHQVCFKHSYKL